jgi:hypothetical protein
MFARFRQVRERLNVSIVETAREGGKVRQEHIATLGSVHLPPSPADRVRFWVKAHQRLSTLDNRLDDKTRLAILTAVNARIPMPTAEDQEAAKNAGREANATIFSALRDKHQGLADTHRRAAENEAAAAAAVNTLEDAYASRPMTRAELVRFLKSIGWSNADLRKARDVNVVCRILGEDVALDMVVKAQMDAGERAGKRVVRNLRANLDRLIKHPAPRP